ncbi:FkbM family methyltransferase [Thalassobaculum sp.]|uniref:FkbM family methyltransferase n=1 Tax=Thalassobaculum sp. TaxID=2022740 RepID=UPI0032EE2475
MSGGLAAQIQAQVKAAEDYARTVPRINLENDGRLVVYRAASKVAALRVLSLFSKEPETIAWIAGMDADSVLYDVGANMGLYTIWAAVTRDATVYAFEPEAGSYAMLCGNIFDNRIAGRVRAYCLGVSDTAGIGEILLSSTDAATSGHQVSVAKAGPTPAWTDEFPQGVVTRTLDGLVYDDGLPCPTHIKIDVDGLEPAIVQGATRLLADRRLRSVLLELDLKSEQHRDTMNAITAVGFERDEDSFQALLRKTTGGNALVGNIIFSR